MRSLTLPVQIPERKKKFNLNFVSTLLCGASEGFIKAVKVFIKHFKVPQRSVKIET